VFNRQNGESGQDLRTGDRRRRLPPDFTLLFIGGLMGMGNKLFAMPWEAFEFSVTKNKLILSDLWPG
jgi:hypothetical protein